MTVPKVHVAAPLVAPYRFGAFSVVQFPAEVDTKSEAGLRWTSSACGTTVGVTSNPCVTDSDAAALTADTEFCQELTAEPFTVYTYAEDTLRRSDPDEVARRFSGAEQFGVEAQVFAALDAAVPAPVDVSTLGSGAEGVRLALAYVEQRLAELTKGDGIIWCDRFAGSVLGDHLRRDGGVARTQLGTPVVAAPGFSDYATDGVPTSVTFYATGPTVAYRSEVETLPALIPATNERATLVQRTYVIGWDCGAVGATVNLAAA